MKMHIKFPSTLSFLLDVILTLTLLKSTFGNTTLTSDFVQLYHSVSTPMSITANIFSINFSPSFQSLPKIFYFITQYSMNDKFIIEHIGTSLSNISQNKFEFIVTPVSTTKILSFSISYIAFDSDTFNNIYISQHSFNNIAELIDDTTSSKLYTSPYIDFEITHPSGTLSTDTSMNQILHSLASFSHETPSDSTQPVDLYMNTYFVYMNGKSYFVIQIKCQTYNIWPLIQLNIMIVNTNFSMFNYKQGEFVLAQGQSSPYLPTFLVDIPSNTSYCFGIVGLKVPSSNLGIDLNLFIINSAQIGFTITNAEYIRHNYIRVWTIAQSTINNPQNLNQQSSSILGYIIGPIIAVLVLCIFLLIYRYYLARKGNRIPMRQGRIIEYNIFSPSFN